VSLALYRRYRSLRFAELIGQSHLAATLRNQVRRGSVAHAYLFAGIRGTGKTSTARILARAVNCLAPQEGEPCNSCAACTEVLGGGAVDVLEIDAASNRGIDEMRELRERVRFLPASLRRKVYIVDEAHMLTPEAWNAFLKTLEEPPPHVLFVLATTEPHKVPETVRSRVQRFDFRRIDAAELHQHLAAVAAAEAVDCEHDALELVARVASGSVRDALSVLEQSMAAGDRPVSVATVRRSLGLADPQTVLAVLAGVAASDAAAALRGVAAAFAAGADARQLLRELARLARGAELSALGVDGIAELSVAEAAACATLGSGGRPGVWVEVIERCAEAEINLRQPVDARLQVELVVLRACGFTGSVAAGGAAALLVGAIAAPSPGMPRPAAQPPRRAAPEGEVDATVETDPTSVAAPPEPTGGAPAAATAEQVEDRAARSTYTQAPIDLDGWVERWPQVLEEVMRRGDTMLAGLLRTCRPVAGSEGRLVVGAPSGFHLDRLQDPQKAARLAEAVAALAGRVCTIEAVYGPRGGTTVPGPPAAAAVDPTDAVLAAFPGSRVTASRRREQPAEGWG